MYEQAFVDVAGRKADVRKAGGGDPLVYLHSAMGEFYGPEFLEPLTNMFQVIVPAHPGFGESTGLEDIEDIEDLALHYADLFAALAIDKAHIVGLSLGGWIAAEIAVRWPNLVRSLVLIDPVGISVEGQRLAPLWGPDRETLVDTLFTNRSHPIAKLMLAFDDESTLPSDEVILQFVSQQTATARIGWNPYLHNPKLAGRLHRIASPSLVVWGKDDRLAPLAYGEKYADLIPGARLEVVEGGHLHGIENPEPLGKLMSDFLGTELITFA